MEMEKYLEKYKNYKLCFIDGGEYHYEWITMYFADIDDVTTLWGDDWDDAPYEHNAEPPYTESSKDEKIDFIQVKVYLDSNAYTPCTDMTNSRYSVEQINKGITPWLSLEKGTTFKHLHAGARFEDVLDFWNAYHEHETEMFIQIK